MSARRGWPLRLAPYVSLVLHLAIGVVPYLVSGLLVPPWAMGLLLLVWTLSLAGLMLTARRRPVLTSAFPVGALVFWFVFVSIGSWLFHWTA